MKYADVLNAVKSGVAAGNDPDFAILEQVMSWDSAQIFRLAAYRGMVRIRSKTHHLAIKPLTVSG